MRQSPMHVAWLRMVERMRLAEKDALEIKLTIYDDTVFTQPYETSDRKVSEKMRAFDLPKAICRGSKVLMSKRA
jgi:hypothetical protein